MAKSRTYGRSRCRYRGVFLLSGKCQQCLHRDACTKIVGRNAILTAMAGILLLALICGLSTSYLSSLDLPEDNQSSTAATSEATESQPEEPVSSTDTPDKESFSFEQGMASKEAEETETTSEPIVEDLFSWEEKIAIGKVIYAESRGEIYEGKIAVGAVILNRLETGRKEYGAHNGNVFEVINKPYAFADIDWITDDYFMSRPEYEECMRAVEDAIKGIDPTESYFGSGGARFFYSIIVELSPEQAAMREGIDILVIGNHAFHLNFDKVA